MKLYGLLAWCVLVHCGQAKYEAEVHVTSSNPREYFVSVVTSPHLVSPAVQDGDASDDKRPTTPLHPTSSWPSSSHPSWSSNPAPLFSSPPGNVRRQEASIATGRDVLKTPRTSSEKMCLPPLCLVGHTLSSPLEVLEPLSKQSNEMDHKTTENNNNNNNNNKNVNNQIIHDFKLPEKSIDGVPLHSSTFPSNNSNGVLTKAIPNAESLSDATPATHIVTGDSETTGVEIELPNNHQIRESKIATVQRVILDMILPNKTVQASIFPPSNHSENTLEISPTSDQTKVPDQPSNNETEMSKQGAFKQLASIYQSSNSTEAVQKVTIDQHTTLPNQSSERVAQGREIDQTGPTQPAQISHTRTEGSEQGSMQQHPAQIVEVGPNTSGAYEIPQLLLPNFAGPEGFDQGFLQALPSKPAEPELVEPELVQSSPSNYFRGIEATVPGFLPPLTSSGIDHSELPQVPRKYTGTDIFEPTFAQVVPLRNTSRSGTQKAVIHQVIPSNHTSPVNHTIVEGPKRVSKHGGPENKTQETSKPSSSNATETNQAQSIKQPPDSFNAAQTKETEPTNQPLDSSNATQTNQTKSTKQPPEPTKQPPDSSKVTQTKETEPTTQPNQTSHHNITEISTTEPTQALHSNHSTTPEHGAQRQTEQSHTNYIEISESNATEPVNNTTKLPLDLNTTGSTGMEAVSRQKRMLNTTFQSSYRTRNHTSGEKAKSRHRRLVPSDQQFIPVRRDKRRCPCATDVMTRLATCRKPCTRTEGLTLILFIHGVIVLAIYVVLLIWFYYRFRQRRKQQMDWRLEAARWRRMLTWRRCVERMNY